MKKSRWIANHYGSRRGLALTFWHRFLSITGRYNDYSHVDWPSINRLVFVCKGNICRSAYAEAVARSLGINAISCGLDTIEHAPANTNAIRAAKQLGINLDEHVTTPIMYLILKKTDLLIAMEPWQVKFLQKNLSRKHSCTLLGLWTQPALPHIHDPYGSSPEYFEQCFTYIQHSVNELSKKIKQKSTN